MSSDDLNRPQSSQPLRPAQANDNSPSPIGTRPPRPQMPQRPSVAPSQATPYGTPRPSQNQPRPTAPTTVSAPNQPRPTAGYENLHPAQEPTSPSGDKPLHRPQMSKFATRQQPPQPPRETPSSNGPEKPEGKSSKKMWMISIIILLLLILGVGAYFFFKSQSELKAAQDQAAQAQIDMELMQLQNDYDALNAGFAQLENQRDMIMDDSIKRDLTEKYETARLQVEKLQQELRESKNRSAAEIAKLKDEIGTLRALLKHYLEEINRLNQENEQLRTENAEIKQENASLTTRVRETTKQNEHLTERMTLAEKLNVTGVSLTPLNKKGKREKKVQKAQQLMVSFTVPQNNSTPVGEKTFYLRLVSPSGQLLGNGGSFTFEGASVACTARKVVEYTGEELTGLCIYYDVDTPLTPGDYTVELFADNFRLCSRSFNLK